MEKTLKNSAIALFIVIFIAHFGAVLNSWYWTFPWYDMPMHFLGGFWVAVVFAYLNLKFGFGIFKEKKFLLNLILIISFVALIGVFWEFFEFFSDFFQNSMDISKMAQLGTADTMGDLFFDLLGGTVFAIIAQKCSILNQ
jgi:hypothetical protein